MYYYNYSYYLLLLRSISRSLKLKFCLNKSCRSAASFFDKQAKEKEEEASVILLIQCPKYRPMIFRWPILVTFWEPIWWIFQFQNCDFSPVKFVILTNFDRLKFKFLQKQSCHNCLTMFFFLKMKCLDLGHCTTTTTACCWKTYQFTSSSLLCNQRAKKITTRLEDWLAASFFFFSFVMAFYLLLGMRTFCYYNSIKSMIWLMSSAFYSGHMTTSNNAKVWASEPLKGGCGNHFQNKELCT